MTTTKNPELVNSLEMVGGKWWCVIRYQGRVIAAAEYDTRSEAEHWLRTRRRQLIDMLELTVED